MINILKSKYKLCRKYNSDIWGLIAANGKFNRVGEYLAESVNRKRNWVWRFRGYKKIIKDRKQVCLFYGGLKLRDYMRYCKEAKEKGHGDYCDDLVSLLELRLGVIVYRLNFVNTVGEGINLVKAGYFLVNNEVVRTPDYQVNVGDVIEVIPNSRCYIWNRIKTRISSQHYCVGFPTYLEVNYQLMSGMLLHKPKVNDVYYPFKLDANFYYMSYNSRI